MEKLESLQVKKYTKIWDRTKGLIGKLRPEAIYFHTRFGIHTFGMKFPIDVIITNEQSKIVALQESLQPNRIFVWNPLYRRVFELPIGTIKKKMLKKNKVIQAVFTG